MLILLARGSLEVEEMAEAQNKRCSLVDNGAHSGKKARTAQPVPNGQHVKQEQGQEEQEEGEVCQGGGEAVASVVVEAMVEPQIDLRMSVALFHCQACLLPLKPPTFKCEAGHVVCCACRGSHGQVCGRAGAYTHCVELDAFIDDAKVPCPYKEFGCESYLVYHDAVEHQRACQFLPCPCPEPGCAFLGSRPMLLDHFSADHSRPVIAVRYGRPRNLSLALSQRWHVLVGDEDRSVFILALDTLGAATAVSLVCVRPADGGAAAPQFWCKLSAELPGDDKDRVVLMTSTVSSSAMPGGAPAPGQGMFLAVPHELLSGEMLGLSVRIDQLRPAAAASRSTTSQARSSRRLL